MAEKRGVKRLISAVVMSVAAAVPLLSGAPAYADNVGTIAGVENRCNSSRYLMCLYYNTSMRTAYWGTSVNVADLVGHRFFANTGTGSGRYVKNDAAAASCDISTTSTCNIYFNRNHMGARDYLYGQRSGQLVDTYNQNASVKFIFA